jgi:hypothetical protein
MSEGFMAYDLAPATRIMVPRATPLRGSGVFQRPRYVPGPLADGMARVVLSEDYYTGEDFSDYEPQSTARREAVFEVPAEQRDRWEAARDAYAAMQEEIGALIEARAREDHG